MSATVAEIAAALHSQPLMLEDEFALHNQIFGVLLLAGADKRWSIDAEVRLSARSRIDFLVDRIGIEVKIKGSRRNFLRQIKRYATSERIDELILFTAVATGMPARIKGKPVHVVSAGRSWMI